MTEIPPTPADPADKTQADKREKIARQFIAMIPHARALGMQVTDVGPGLAEVTMPYDPRLVGDPDTGVIHGGAVSALMDTCCGAAVIAHPDASLGTATIDLRIDYMRGATPGQQIRAVATCYRMTRSVAFVRANAYDDDPDNPVACATGAFTVERPKDTP
ncbi:PaaI family thioesterase [Loktanella sp. SALINAS62]|uniref:PaaI family thioesterase n=1 Tax=Loktanella sp. SALINAS62 TaxID=2706124 RepID=UPI001B8C4939|nr:PaaI family thioesterase [Loktanella sp. SALINAS62]MBS1303330.1 PaaI family thioesterase [Loktanella sp. SALINAS62]